MTKMRYEQEPEKIREKMNAGLTREQAIEVLERQAEHDAETAKREKKTGK